MDAAQPLINILGESVALGPLQRDLLPTYHRWINDFATLRTMVPLCCPALSHAGFCPILD